MNHINVKETRNIKLGDTVNIPSFVDCFGKIVKAKTGYVVSSITAWTDYTPYYRLKAHNPIDPFQYFEGAENFFEVSR